MTTATDSLRTVMHPCRNLPRIRFMGMKDSGPSGSTLAFGLVHMVAIFAPN